MLLFAASTNLGYCIFTYANEEFTNVFVRDFAKSDATGFHFGNSSNRLENCYVTASQIFCSLR